MSLIIMLLAVKAELNYSHISLPHFLCDHLQEIVFVRGTLSSSNRNFDLIILRNQYLSLQKQVLQII